MFTQLIFLMILLLLTGFHNEAGSTELFFFALGCYGIFLIFLFFQNVLLRKYLRRRKEAVLFLANIEILTALAFFYLFAGIPKLSYIPSTFSTSLALLLYFLGLFVFHASSFQREARNRFQHALGQIELLLPFALPLLIYSVVTDLLLFMGLSLDELPFWALSIFSFSLAGSLLLFLPPVLVRIWRCVPMEKGELLDRLERLCSDADFRHGGIKIWTVLNYAPTAAIIGVLPSLRYILFTRKLLRSCTPDDVEAILAHEIGHSAHKHLLKFPLVLFGMAIGAALLLSFIERAVELYFDTTNWLDPSPYSESVAMALIFLLLAAFVALYVRYVFGYFSRLFERQADLYGIQLGLPPERMVHALESVAVAAGNIHDVPSWHHYSIAQRVAYLKRVEADPSLPAQHDRKTAFSLLIFLAAAALGVATLISPEIPHIPFFSWLNRTALNIEKSIAEEITLPLRITASERYTANRGMESYSSSLKPALLQAFSVRGVFNRPAYLDHAVLSYLLQNDDAVAAAALAVRILEECDGGLLPGIKEEIIKKLPETLEGSRWASRLAEAGESCMSK